MRTVFSGIFSVRSRCAVSPVMNLFGKRSPQGHKEHKGRAEKLKSDRCRYP